MSRKAPIDVTFSWKIENFSFIDLENETIITSPPFTVEDIPEDRFYIDLCPKSWPNNVTKYVSCCLRSTYSKCVVADCSLEMTDSKHNVIHAHNITLNPFDRLQMSSIISFQNLRELMSMFCPDDVLIIRWQIREKLAKLSILNLEAKTFLRVHEFSCKWNVDVQHDLYCSKECFPECLPSSKLSLFLCRALTGSLSLYLNCTNFQGISKIAINIIDNEGKTVKALHFTGRLVKKSFPVEINPKQLKVGNSAWYKFVIELNLKVCTKTSSNIVTPSVDSAAETNVTDIVSFSNSNDLMHSSSAEANITDIDSFSGSNVLHNDLGHSSSDETSVTNIESLSRSNGLGTLQKDLIFFFLSNMCSDVKLRIENQGELPAHKVILCSRSPVFYALIDQKKHQTDTIDVLDVDIDTLTVFLKFLYTDLVEVSNSSNALKLLIIAHKYEVSLLKEKCINFLISVLSAENVCDVILAANTIEEKALKKSAIDYVKANKKTILQTSNWTQFVSKNVTLGMEILTLLALD